VATRTGGTPSIVRDGDNGLLVPAADAQALADAIARILRGPALAMHLAQNGRHRARREFDWHAVMARHECAISRALARPQARSGAGAVISR
jgi:hypothetical protein